MFDLTPLAHISNNLALAIGLQFGIGLAIGTISGTFGVGGGFFLPRFTTLS